MDNGTYELNIEVESAKNYYDGNGKHLSAGDSANLLELSVFEKDTINAEGMTIKSPLVMEKKWVQPGKSS